MAGKALMAASAAAPVMLEIRELAAMLKLCPKTVHRMTEAGRIPGKIHFSKRAVRWRRDVIEKWIAAGCPAGEATTTTAAA